MEGIKLSLVDIILSMKPHISSQYRELPEIPYVQEIFTVLESENNMKIGQDFFLHQSV